MKRFAIVVSQFNESITNKLLEGALLRLTQSGISSSNISVTHVPGAIEIPMTAQLLAKTSLFDVIIALGCVIRGETSHYDYVCEQVSQGCQRVMLDYEIPIIFGVLTTETLNQAEERVGGGEGHKGVDAADAALMMLNVIDKISAEN